MEAIIIYNPEKPRGSKRATQNISTQNISTQNIASLRVFKKGFLFYRPIHYIDKMNNPAGVP